MQIDIQARGFHLTEALRAHVTRRLGFALHGRDQAVRRVRVRLSDINGPRGGEDKCCHVQITLDRLSDVIVKDVQGDLYAAIDRAADRVGGALARRLKRQRIRRRLFGSAFDKHHAAMSEGAAPESV